MPFFPFSAAYRAWRTQNELWLDPDLQNWSGIMMQSIFSLARRLLKVTVSSAKAGCLACFLLASASPCGAALAQPALSALAVQSASGHPFTGAGNLPRKLSIAGMFSGSSPIVKTVIVALLLASVATWTIWIAKNVEMNAARASLKRAVATLSSAGSLNDVARTGNSVADALLADALAEFRQSEGLRSSGANDRIAARLERIQAAAIRQAQSGTNSLASIGATAPFVGLFGTVWGIMYSFIGISQAQTTNLMVVAPGIAEALLATATGLIAAVPAVVIYNTFARSISGYRGLVGDAATLIMCIAGRDLDRRAEAG